MADGINEIGRRAFLQGIGVALAAPAWLSCSGGSGSKTPSGAGDPPFDVWREIREAIRSSPDALGDRAAALVAAKDAQGLFAFVRDAIATLPPPTAATERSRRWGTAATLRGGAGTPRERADLLASLLTQAGFSASVVSGSPAGDLTGGGAAAKVYGRTFDRAFAPADQKKGADWVARLGGTGHVPMPGLLDPNGDAAGAIFDALDALLPATVSATGGLFGLFDVPFVALDQGGTTAYLNPLSADAVFGEPYATDIQPAPAADPLPTIGVRLLASRASDPETQFSLVEATYTADQLVGRQLFVQTQPGGAIDDLLAQPLSNIVAFVPTLGVGGADLSADERAKLLTTGPWVTQAGDILARAADGTVTCNGVPLGTGAGASASAVASLDVRANASAFPQIELTVGARDAGGKPVVGLGASAFTVEEGGAALSFALRDNGVAPPRVVFLVDTTGSQPQITSAWASAVAQALYGAAPDATAQVVNITAGMASSTGYTLTDATSLASALAAVPVGGVLSNLYTALLAAQATTPTLVVLLSDGDAEDKDLAGRALASLAGGAPVVAVTCVTPGPLLDSPVMDAIATASGGVAVAGADLSDPTPVASALAAAAGGRVASPYRLSYTAPAQGPSTRQVTVKAGPSAMTSYDLPAQPSPQAAITGLYLELSLTLPNGAPETYTRVLGGYIPKSGANDPAVLAAAIADARAAMLGGVVISFEASAPSLSTWIGDFAGWRLATEPASNAFVAGDMKGGFMALADVPTTIPREAVSLHAVPLPVPNVVVYEQSLRAVLFRVRPGPTPYHADILPFTRFVSASASGIDDYFRINLRASLRLALAEAGAFKTSAAALLSGKPLALLPRGGVGAADVPPVPAAESTAFVAALNEYGDWYRIIASDGSTTAFWVVHPSTGSALAVLADASGGGENPCVNYKEVEAIFNILSIFSDILGCPFLSLWAEIGKLVALAGVETLMAFNYTPVAATGDTQLGAIGCSFASGLLGSAPLSHSFGQEGVATLVTNSMQAVLVDTSVGKFKTCVDVNPCG